MTMVSDPIQKSICDLLKPRILACVAGAYSDGAEHCLDLATARAVIRVTRTNACVMNIPRRQDMIAKASLLMSDLMDSFVDPSLVVPLLNTSRATSSTQAHGMIESTLPTLSNLGAYFQRAPLLKLEILDRDLRVLDDETLECVRQLDPDVRHMTIPILSPIPDVIQEAVSLGCPAVRLLTGKISQRTGVLDHSIVSAAIASAQGRPVILEGGIDSPEDICVSARLGAAGVLMNSAFLLALNPIAQAIKVRTAADRAWSNGNHAMTP